MSNWKLIGISVPCALALGVGVVAFFDYISPSNVKARKHAIYQERENERRKIIEHQKEIEQRRKQEEVHKAQQERIRKEKQREYLNSDEYKANKAFQRGMDYYEGRNGKNINNRKAFNIFFETADTYTHDPSMNMLGVTHYNREDPWGRRYQPGDGSDIAKTYWEAAASIGNQEAKENLNKIIRNRK